MGWLSPSAGCLKSVHHTLTYLHEIYSCKKERRSRLRLDANELLMAPPQLIHMRDFLTSLDLSNNKIAYLNAQILTHLTTLTTLDVRLNHLRYLEAGIMKP